MESSGIHDEGDSPRPTRSKDRPVFEFGGVVEDELGLLGLPRDKDRPDHDLRHALPLRPESYFSDEAPPTEPKIA